MTLRSALLSFRISRFETTVIVGGAALSVIVSALVITAFNAGGYAHCFGSSEPVFTVDCQSTAATWISRIARLSASIVPIFPVVAGLLAGGPIVARELETGTARLAWSLGPSRLRWFVQRALPILVMVFLAGLAVGLTADALLKLVNPGADLDRSFVGFRWRGLLVGVEAVLVASIALAFGAILGRMVPTIIVSLIVILGLVIGVDKLERETLIREAEIGGGQTYFWTDANLNLESRMRFPNGEILSYEVAFATHPELQQEWTDQPPWEDVVLYIPGERYHDIERREALGFGALALVLVAGAGIVVARRRPR
ncbi:MAG: hypothetical protein ACJ75R_08605 [Solirubrobacterales bacterium]